MADIATKTGIMCIFAAPNGYALKNLDLNDWEQIALIHEPEQTSK